MAGTIICKIDDGKGNSNVPKDLPFPSWVGVKYRRATAQGASSLVALGVFIERYRGEGGGGTVNFPQVAWR